MNAPHDLEAELSVLAELAEPLHHDLSEVTVDDFYDSRHQRLFRHIKGETLRVPLSDEDLAYLEHIKQYAWPITKSGMDAFYDCAERRRLLVELEARRLELLG